MSFNRTKYDTCGYKKDLSQSVNVGKYFLYGGKYYHDHPCRIDLGIVGGNNVSLYNGNLVDLESELRGQAKYLSRCPDHSHFSFQANKGECMEKNIEKMNRELYHQPSCQMIRYPTVILPPPFRYSSCPNLYK